MWSRLQHVLRRIGGRPGVTQLPVWTTDASSPFAVASANEWLVRAGKGDRAELGHLLAGLMRKVGPHDWTRLYANFRSPWIEPADVARLERLPADDAVEMIGVATLSASGYTREAALHALGRLGHPRAVPYILLRLGDWVEEVRQAAITTLRMIMDRGVAGALIEHHNLIEHLRVVQRVDLSSLDAEIRARLQEPSSRTAVESGLIAERVAVRLFCFRLLEDELRQQPSLVERALGDSDPVVRSWLAATVARGRLDVADTIFRSLLCDKSSRVSTTMIRALEPDQVASNRAELLELAMADTRPVRESARFVLSRAASIDFAATCRSRLQSAHDAIRPGWVACLGETGDASDFERIIALVDHARSPVRAAAVTAAGRLDRDRAAPMVVGLLADSSGHVRRAAAGVLAQATPSRWTSTAYEILRSGPERGKAAAMNALALRGSWDAVPPLLYGLLTDSALVQSRAWQGIYDWHRHHGSRGWIKPSSECRRWLQTVWAQARSLEDVPDWAADEWTSLKRWIDALVGEVVQ